MKFPCDAAYGRAVQEMLLSFEYGSAQFSCWGPSSYCFVNLILTLQSCHSICSGSITSVLTDSQDRLLALEMCKSWIGEVFY